MKTIKDYLKANGSFKETIGSREIGFSLWNDDIIIEVDDADAVDIYELETHYDIQDALEENYGLEVRFCEECGKPYDAGFMAGDGDWYCCEDCFDDAMNTAYGVGNWRATEEPGEYDGFYEAFGNGVWEDTGIFYTEWN